MYLYRYIPFILHIRIKYCNFAPKILNLLLMKKIALTLCAVMALVMVGCGNSETTKEDTLAAQEALQNPEEIIDETVLVESDNTPRENMDSAISDIKDAANQAGEAIEGSAETLKEKSAAKVNEFKEKAGAAIEESTQKVQEAVGNAGNALENALN